MQSQALPQSTAGFSPELPQLALHAPSPQNSLVARQAVAPLPQSTVQTAADPHMILACSQLSTSAEHVTLHAYVAAQVIVASSHASVPLHRTSQAKPAGHVIAL